MKIGGIEIVITTVRSQREPLEDGALRREIHRQSSDGTSRPGRNGSVLGGKHEVCAPEIRRVGIEDLSIWCTLPSYWRWDAYHQSLFHAPTVVDRGEACAIIGDPNWTRSGKSDSP